MIPPERLLIHDAKNGWEPLCEFLGKPVPDTPYPRSNDAAKAKRVLLVVRWLGRLPWIVGVVLAIAALVWLV